jgi:hypothetical protein
MLWLALAACGLAEAAPMTVDEAYAAIPHRRTVFDASASKASRAQVESLKRIFTLAEQATVLRVEAMRSAPGGSADAKRVLAQYDALLESARSQPVSAEVKPAQDLVMEAIRHHRRFLEARAAGGRGAIAHAEISRAPDVIGGHEKLIKAYNLLMQSFPNEPAVNKTSFYDYLCALDYL